MSKLNGFSKKVLSIKSANAREEQEFVHKATLEVEYLGKFEKELQQAELELTKISDFYKEKGVKPYKLDRLFPLLCNKGLLYSSMKSVKSRWGSLIPGVHFSNKVELIDLVKIEHLSESLQNEEYEPAPIQELYTPVSRKNKPKGYHLVSKKRVHSLKVTSFLDKIVQESLAVLLTAVFEPEFALIDKNYGCRPGKSAQDAVEILQKKGRGMTYAIQADLTTLSTKLKNELLITLVKSKTNDKKIVRLIKKLLSAGYLHNKELADGEMNLSQTSVMAPLFLNICLNEFDKHMFLLEELLNERNRTEMRKDGVKSQRYESLRTQIKYKEHWIKTRLNDKRFDSLGLQEQELITTKNVEIKELKKQMNKTKYITQNLDRLRMCYVRYGNSWIVLTNVDKEHSLDIKNRIETYLTKSLELNLGENCCSVTEITKSKAKFLGFTFQNNQKHAPVSKMKMNGKDVTRRTARDLLTGIDRERVFQRMQVKGFVTQDKMLKGKRNGSIQLLRVFEIVEKYQQIIAKVFDYYYYNLTYKSMLSDLHYYLYYSCFHTIAAREKSSIAAVIGKYSKQIVCTKKVITMQNGNQVETTKTIKLRSYKETIQFFELKRRAHIQGKKWDQELSKRRNTSRGFESQSLFQVEALFDYHVNLRTKKPATNSCVICSKNENQAVLEVH